MATPRISSSQRIRDVLMDSPDLTAKEVVAQLAAKGVKVSEALVYSVKGGLKEKKNRKARVVKAAKAAAIGTNGAPSKVDALSMIRDVKALAHRAGGYEQLKELVDALAE